jgi:hypothetical protein
MLCENCNSYHSGEFGSGRFCSISCSRSFSTKLKRSDINRKVSKTLSNITTVSKNCPICNVQFEVKWKNRNQKHCSIRCSNKSNAKKSRKPGRIGNLGALGKTWKWSEESKRNLSSSNRGGRCKWYDFIKTDNTLVKLQGSYELRFASVLNSIDPDWIKPTIHDRPHQFEWIDSNGNTHWYTPDFWSPKLNKYFEIKGFWPKQFEEKRKFVESLSDIVKIVYKEDLEKMEINMAIY